jgi:hypothetical protein
MAHDRLIPAESGIGGLKPRQEALALHVAGGLSLSVAARKAKVPVGTAKTWSATLPGFRHRVQELRAEMTERAMARLIDSMTSAADTLGFLCRRAKNEQVRLGAAKAVLELGCRLKETVELEARIAELEGRANGRRGVV